MPGSHVGTMHPSSETPPGRSAPPCTWLTPLLHEHPRFCQSAVLHLSPSVLSGLKIYLTLLNDLILFPLILLPLPPPVQ